MEPTFSAETLVVGCPKAGRKEDRRCKLKWSHFGIMAIQLTPFNFWLWVPFPCRIVCKPSELGKKICLEWIVTWDVLCLLFLLMVLADRLLGLVVQPKPGGALEWEMMRSLCGDVSLPVGDGSWWSVLFFFSFFSSPSPRLYQVCGNRKGRWVWTVYCVALLADGHSALSLDAWIFCRVN